MTASNDWLQDYLKDAVDRKLCVKYGCTTCGAGEFREGLKRVAIQNSSVPEDAWTTLGQALGQLEPGIGEATRLGDAARLVIMELCGSLGEERTEQLLGDGWASGLFRSMEAHHEAVEHGRRRHIEEQERAQQAKGAQRRLRAEQHAQRLARKALRDAARKASHSEDAARSPTNIIGLDCATEPTKVGLVLARFSGELLVIQEARCGTRTVSPASIVAGWIRSSRRVLLALDAPLGWPAGLSSALQGHSAGSMVPATANEMFRRVTDNEIYRRLGKRPLDVGADRIARTTRAALEVLGRSEPNTPKFSLGA